MPDKAVYLLVVEGFADWEPAHAVAELRRHGNYRVEAVGLTLAPVRSMGGITVLPSKVVSEVDPADVAVFILPGGDRWEQGPVEPELEAALRRLDAGDVPIAAICAATVAISRLGLLRGRRHTSNGLDYLRSHAPGLLGSRKLRGCAGRSRSEAHYRQRTWRRRIRPGAVRGAGRAECRRSGIVGSDVPQREASVLRMGLKTT